MGYDLSRAVPSALTNEAIEALRLPLDFVEFAGHKVYVNITDEQNKQIGDYLRQHGHYFTSNELVAIDYTVICAGATIGLEVEVISALLNVMAALSDDMTVEMAIDSFTAVASTVDEDDTPLERAYDIIAAITEACQVSE